MVPKHRVGGHQRRWRKRTKSVHPEPIGDVLSELDKLLYVPYLSGGFAPQGCGQCGLTSTEGG
jgi:hypothetical protein